MQSVQKQWVSFHSLSLFSEGSKKYLQLWPLTYICLLTLFSWGLCDDHTPRAMSAAAFCHKMANFVQNSNFDIARARAEGSSAPAMSKFEF